MHVVLRCVHRSPFIWLCLLQRKADGDRRRDWLGDLWTSADGVSWEKEPVAASFTPRSGMGAAVWNGSLYVASGLGADAYLRDIWVK